MNATHASSRHPVALITGASSGIGELLALEFAAAGYDLALVARRQDRLRTLGARVESEHGARVAAIGSDLRDPTAPPEIVRRALAEFGRIDVLVNNAGFGVHGAVADTAERAELNLLQVNVMALVHLTKLVLPDMVRHGSGRILNVASTAGFFPGPYMAGYYASKAFVVSFSEALAVETEGTGVTVSVLCPGPTATEFNRAAGIGETRLPGGAMAAGPVARAGYLGAVAGRRVIVPGLRNRILVFARRVAPPGLLSKTVRYLNRER